MKGLEKLFQAIVTGRSLPSKSDAESIRGVTVEGQRQSDPQFAEKAARRASDFAASEMKITLTDAQVAKVVQQLKDRAISTYGAAITAHLTREDYREVIQSVIGQEEAKSEPAQVPTEASQESSEVEENPARAA